MRIAQLELDLDVFAGPFDLLLSLILREELDLLEVDLAEVVIAYLDHLEAQEQLDLESATEFLVLIAALLELKSRLMLPGEEVAELDELGPAEAAEELIERMLQYARFRAAGAHMAGLHEHGQAFLLRSARLPEALRQVPLAKAEAAYDPAVLGAALGSLLRMPAPIDLTHMAMPRVTVGERLKVLRDLLRRGRFSLRGGGQGRRPRDRLRDRVRAARALQERRGRVGAGGAVRPDHGDRRRAAASRGMRLDAQLEALLFLAPEPVERRGARRRPAGLRGGRRRRRRRSSRPTSRAAAWSCAGVAGGLALASHPDAEEAARRLLARPRTPALTPAQAETLAIVAYLQPVSRPEVARIRGVASESATTALVDRGLIEEAGRSQFGAVLYRTTPLFLKLFGLDVARGAAGRSRSGIRAPRRPPTLRERLLRAGEAAASAKPPRQPSAARRAGPAREQQRGADRTRSSTATITPSETPTGRWPTMSSISILAPTKTSSAPSP